MPYQRYRQDLQREDFHHDPAQEQAIRHLQRVYDELLKSPQPTAPKGWLARFTGGHKAGLATPVKGLYIWGGVGRGKTYLVDTFHDALPLERKLRIHFHSFMQKVHHELKTLKERQNPLDTVAERLAQQTRVLCLDEFFVSDITDAMLLHGLLKGLFERGVTLVTTSNIPPDDLYKDGLQRARFLPAIELLKTHTMVLHMDAGVDYRLRYLETAEIYHHPLDKRATEILEDAFDHIAPEPGHRGGQIEVEGRHIPVRREADGVVWFDFRAICDGPRGQADYIEIARTYHTVLISAVPVLDWQMENQARRFLNLVDEFYDRSVKLILATAAPIDNLYRGEKLKFEYRRAVSRLQEMRSHDYLARGHRA
ncbi:MAG: cell division protein ZapE [Candidatus Competibacteraceae bacterium]|nr:cell division protein ZapE [Candidatus Competibacteraceae bacterium]